MKIVFIISMFLAVSLAGKRREEIKEAVIACGGDAGGTNDLRKQVTDENVDQAALGAKIFCVNKKIGVQNDHGDIDENVFRKDLKAVVEDEAKVNEIVAECGKRKGDTPEAAAFNFLKCYEKNVPTVPQ